MLQNTPPPMSTPHTTNNPRQTSNHFYYHYLLRKFSPQPLSLIEALSSIAITSDGRPPLTPPSMHKLTGSPSATIIQRLLYLVSKDIPTTMLTKMTLRHYSQSSNCVIRTLALYEEKGMLHLHPLTYCENTSVPTKWRPEHSHSAARPRPTPARATAAPPPLPSAPSSSSSA